MGISGLLPLLKEVQVSGNIKEFKGQRLAVDAYVWLHKGAFGCAEALVKGHKTTKFVDYAMHRVRLLRHYGITPFIVFDGGPLPAKKGTEVSRAKSRAEHLERARAFEAQGRVREARECYTRCVDVTPEMAYQFIKALRAENVEYVVAPYEADAQLCFLEREGYVDGIITEDSDLLVFGCRQVIFKLDGNGDCVWIHRDRLAQVREFPMHGWTDLQFRRMAMLSGCDYLDSIPGIGLKTAHRLLRRFNSVEKLLQFIRLEGSHVVPPSYLADFAQAELAFLHQRVYHPHEGRLVPLNDFPEGGLGDADERWIGLDVEAAVAKGMAAGDLHPETREPIVDEWPDYRPTASSGKEDGIAGAIGGKVAGPMDAFITRKRPKPVLPNPVGTFGSGPSRLSDQRPAPLLPDEDDSPSPVPATRKSKFFSHRQEDATPELQDVELKWENSDDDPPVDSHPAIRSPVARSPSPAISSIKGESSPIKSQFDAHALTSPPLGSAPMLSSPPCSSPPPPSRSPPRTVKQEVPQRRISPLRGIPRAPSITASMMTPTPAVSMRAETSVVAQRITRILVPASSPFGSQATQEQEQELESLSVTRTMVPASSSPEQKPVDLRRALRIGEGSSSDAVSGEEVVTPAEASGSSAGSKGKRKRSGEKKVKVERGPEVEEEEDEDERKRAEKAKALGGGWRAKYAFGSQSSSSPTPDGDAPTPRATKPLVLQTPAFGARRPTAALSAKFASTTSAPRVLTSRPTNVPTPTRAFTPTLPTKNSRMSAKKPPAPVPARDKEGNGVEEEESEAIGSFSPTPEPEVEVEKVVEKVEQVVVRGSTLSKLEKFRFGGKAVVRK
ncbi:hypothetical protein IAT38_000035 [Cryptococcus sp. DSM 104549]